MLVKPFFTALLIVAASGTNVPRALAQDDVQSQRVGASFILALGRQPTPAERGQWIKLAAPSMAELMVRQRRMLQADTSERQAMVARTCRDALGRAPDDQEMQTWSGAGKTYFELMQERAGWLAANPKEYEQVVRRAYRFTIRRDPYEVEIEYWKRQETHPYAVLVACLDNWARRNQPGLMVTGGLATASVNCDFLSAVRLSPAIVAEVRAAAGFPAEVAPDIRDTRSAAGHNLIAAGGGEVISDGRIHFVAAGAAGLAADVR